MKTTDKPTLQDFHIEGVKHIAPSEAHALIKNGEAVLIDVREENETRLESIPLDNVLYHPMSVIMERLPYISKEQNIIVGCPGGVRSTKVANLLINNGYPNVANLDGGFSMWRAKGLPFSSNIFFGGGCGCGRSTESIDKNGCC
ncbi:MAG: rhodanese-like domain-containing protein [Bacteroidales bacterium]